MNSIDAMKFMMDFMHGFHHHHGFQKPFFVLQARRFYVTQQRLAVRVISIMLDAVISAVVNRVPLCCEQRRRHGGKMAARGRGDRDTAFGNVHPPLIPLPFISYSLLL